MIDLPLKVHHTVQMACAARALAGQAPSDHLKRVIGRWAFVYLHDVVRFAPALPPSHVDSEHVIWVSGPQGSKMAPAVAGLIAGRAHQVRERLEAYNRGPAALKTPGGR